MPYFYNGDDNRLVIKADCTGAQRIEIRPDTWMIPKFEIKFFTYFAAASD